MKSMSLALWDTRVGTAGHWPAADHGSATNEDRPDGERVCNASSAAAGQQGMAAIGASKEHGGPIGNQVLARESDERLPLLV